MPLVPPVTSARFTGARPARSSFLAPFARVRSTVGRERRRHRDASPSEEAPDDRPHGSALPGALLDTWHTATRNRNAASSRRAPGRGTAASRPGAERGGSLRFPELSLVRPPRVVRGRRAWQPDTDGSALTKLYSFCRFFCADGRVRR